MLRLIYNLLFPAVLLAMLPSIVIRMARRGNYRHKFGQRFGIYSSRVRSKLAGRSAWTWVHAVSVGEVMVALKLIARLRALSPQTCFVLSTTTSTGYRLAHRRRCEWLEPIYHPLDLPWSVERAFRTIRPERMVLVEAEVWPNAMAKAARLGLPRVLVNARLSARSERRYRAVRRLSASLFNCLDAICLQEEGDRGRWESLGVHASRLHLTGSIKFDTEEEQPGSVRELRPALEDLGVGASDPVVVGGSTFDGEETLLAEVCGRLRAQFPGLFLVLVPRHAERGRAVLSSLTSLGHRAVLRSEPDASTRPDILVVNTTGELKDWYRCGRVAFIGKSLARVATGGQNPAEALVAGVPVVFGPGMKNFATLARQLLAAGAGIQVGTPGALADALALLLADEGKRRVAVERGRACLAVHQGATDRTARLLLRLR
jgi:3-deoxy-D-manno-octulosonic-acid transferase